MVAKKKADKLKAKKKRILKAKMAKAQRKLKLVNAKKKKLQAAKAKKTTKKSIVIRVKVADLLTKKDLKDMETGSIAMIAIKIDGERYLVSKQHTVPSTAKLERTDKGQVTGVKAVASG